MSDAPPYRNIAERGLNAVLARKLKIIAVEQVPIYAKLVRFAD